MLVAKEFGVSPPGAVGPRRRAPPARVAAGGGGSPVGELWLRTRGAAAAEGHGGSSHGGGSSSHESELDLAMLVSDFLEGGSGDSRGSSDGEPGLADLAHLADKISVCTLLYVCPLRSSVPLLLFAPSASALFWSARVKLKLVGLRCGHGFRLC
jgi:hypothetical protein